MTTSANLFHCVRRPVYGVAALAMMIASSGCVMYNTQAYRAEAINDGFLRITDPEPVPLPRSGPSSIDIFWKDHGRRELTGRPMPQQPYVIIGQAAVVASVPLQYDALLDVEFRRAAAALEGDAVIDVHRGKYIQNSAANEYLGKIIKWKTAATTPGAAKEDAKKPATKPNPH